MFESVLIVSFAAIICFYFAFFVVKKWDLMPLVLLLVLWYIPRQTGPGGLLEDYIIARWLSVMFIPLIVVVQFFKMAMRKEPVELSAIILPLIVYVVFCICSGIINEVQPTELVGSVVLYIRYPLLFIAFINMHIKKQTVKKFLALFLFLLAIQIPECLYRFLVLGIHGDFISFTLGPWGHFDLGIYAIYGAAFVVAYNAIIGIKWYHLIFFALLLLVSLIGEIKALAIAIPIISVLTIYATFRQKKLRKYFLIIAFPVFFIVLIYFASAVWDKVHTLSGGNTLEIYLEKITYFVTEPSLLVTSEEVDYSSSRFLGSAFVWNHLKDDWRMLVFGIGPGALLAGNFLGVPGQIFEEVPYLNQIAVILGETGIIGLVIFAWMLLRILGGVIKVNKTSEDKDVRIISAAIIGIWVFYALLGPFYDLVWRHDSPNYIFYFFAAFLHRYSYVHKS